MEASERFGGFPSLSVARCLAFSQVLLLGFDIHHSCISMGVVTHKETGITHQTERHPRRIQGAKSPHTCEQIPPLFTYVIRDLEVNAGCYAVFLLALTWIKKTGPALCLIGNTVSCGSPLKASASEG